jgi:HK97 family phage portal protein
MGLLDFFRSEKRNNNFLNANSNFSFGGAANRTSVTTDSSMTFSAVFACVRIISESIASLPVRVYRVETDGDKIEELAHPVNRLLTRKPNDFMTTYTFLDVLMNNLLLEGNSYFYIERDSTARPVGLIPIKTQHVKVINHDGQIYYDVKDYDLAIRKEDMLHFFNLSFNGYEGTSVIGSQRTTIGTSIASNDTANSYLGNSSQIGGIIKHPGKLSKEAVARLRTSWSQSTSGSFVAGKTAILEEGMTFEQSKINANDYQLLETRRFQIEEIARIFKVPLSLIGHLEKAANYSSIEALSIDFVRFTLQPYLVLIEQELNRKLFRENELDNYFVRLDSKGLLRGDSAARATYYREMSAIGVLSINEIRRMEDLNRIGDEGDIHYYPLNFAPIGQTEENE